MDSFLNGKLDDIGIWNRALTYCEINQLYTATIPTAGELTGPSAVCAGSTITLSDTAVGGVWSSTNSKATVSGGVVTGISAGADTINYIFTTTCGSALATSIIAVNPLPTPIVITSGLTLSTSSAYTAYQWLIGGSPISGATNATYSIGLNGAYSVEVTDSNGCSATSAVTIITNVGVQNTPAPYYYVKVYPNPSQFEVTVQSSVVVDIQLTTVDGRLLLDKKAVKEIDISNLPSDVYILNVYEAATRLKLKTERVVKMD